MMYTLKDARLLLNISMSSLNLWIRKHGIERKKVGKRTYISDDDISLMLQRRMTNKHNQDSKETDKELVSLREAAKYLGVSESRLRRWLFQSKVERHYVTTDTTRLYLSRDDIMDLGNKQNYKFPDQQEKLYTLLDITILLRLSRDTIRNWIKQDQIPNILLQTDRKRVYLSESSLVALAEKHNREIYWNALAVSKEPDCAYVFKAPSKGVKLLGWSSNSKRIASAGSDKTIQVWDVTTGQHLFTYKGHTAMVFAMAWSPDGQHIASAGVDKTVQVWDASSGKRVFTYKGHKASVLAIAWSPDGKRIASASVDKTVQVWDAFDGGHPFTYLKHVGGVRVVVWSPDGKFIASGDDESVMQVWLAK